MRTITVVLLLCLSASALADQSNFRNKLTSMLTMKARAADAVDAALTVLRDLKQANVDAQEQADKVNQTQEADCAQEKADLQAICDQNKSIGDEATNRRKYLESEIATTTEYLEWVANRREDIHKRSAELEEQRCYANNLFVRALKEHQDALDVIAMLRDDLLPFAGNAEAAPELA